MTRPLRVVSVVGARPQFVKLKPVHDALEAVGAEHIVIHTGQHYDVAMSKAFFHGLKLPDPTEDLGVGSGSHSDQTGRMLIGLEPILQEHSPDWVLVYGDTNSTIAGALSAAKMGLPLAHIEAGLRSFNRTMPEEINRIATDHMADLLFAPTSAAMSHLTREGLESRALLVGDVMADLVAEIQPQLSMHVSNELRAAGVPYVVATLHRPSNTDDPKRLAFLIDRLSELNAPVLLIAHPRLKSAARSAGLDLTKGSIRVLDPQPYLEMMILTAQSAGVVTDSGGLQKEAFLLGVPCTTLRAETEWPETLTNDRNVLDPEASLVSEMVIRTISVSDNNPYGDGRAAARMVDELLRATSVGLSS